ncbi:uncharacterized protein BcabD6B2_18930 [Babesia caballi]|uniref:Uncharacterized protein n=1 Tax=Babesia caballi TaxID=5871 RepID=A0AAV4LQK9_BABCB|nr:hypothetical protein, conserved [Babesia caballi]
MMESDCEGWNPSDMSNGKAAGPFPYGFGFPQSWNQGTAQTALSTLTDDSSDGLPALKRHVENLIGSSTSSSAGSIAGGLLGTAAVGGAGAAVALNLEVSISVAPKVTDLKEAIDWVLRVSGRDNGRNDNNAISELAKELIKLLDKDAAEVARGVLEVMGGVIDGFVTKLNNADGNHKPGQGTFRVLKAYLRTFKGNLENVRDYGSSVSQEDRDKLKQYLTSEPSGAIGKLADGLKTFIGYQDGQVGSSGIGKTGSYRSKYDKDQTKWPSKPDEQKTCALIFLGIAPMLLYGLTYLYWWCSKGERNKRWSEANLTSDTSTLSKFMKAIGFENKYLKDSQNTGKDVAKILNKAFANELSDAKVNDKSHYKFQESLSQTAKGQLSPSTSPLSCCHRIASPFFTPNDTYTVQSTRPTTPFFAGYSGTAALAGGAYGFNLGGLGTFMSALLA